MKRYVVRALKYFVYLCIILFAIITVLVALGIVEKDVDAMFVNGRDSLWQIALIVAAFAAVYPRIGYSKRLLQCTGEPSRTEGVIIRHMEERGYEKTFGDAEKSEFRKTNHLVRAMKMFEDTISFTRTLEGYVIEGRTKDIVRIESALCSRLKEGS